MANRRVGLILPSVNIHIEPEFYRLGAITDINFHAARVMLTDTTEETLVQMEQGLERAAELIATVYPEAVLYACTSGSFIKGADWDEQIMRKIERICHCPAVTASRAMVDAMKAMGIKRLTLVTPYTDDINEREKAFIEGNGIEVVAMKGLNIVDAETLRTLTPQQVTNLVLETDVASSEGVFISCTNVEGMYIAQGLEQRLSKPVLSSNSASLGALLKMLDYGKPIVGYGSFLNKAYSAEAVPLGAGGRA